MVVVSPRGHLARRERIHIERRRNVSISERRRGGIGRPAHAGIAQEFHETRGKSRRASWPPHGPYAEKADQSVWPEERVRDRPARSSSCNTALQAWQKPHLAARARRHARNRPCFHRSRHPSRHPWETLLRSFGPAAPNCPWAYPRWAESTGDSKRRKPEPGRAGRQASVRQGTASEPTDEC